MGVFLGEDFQNIFLAQKVPRQNWMLSCYSFMEG